MRYMNQSEDFKQQPNLEKKMENTSPVDKEKMVKQETGCNIQDNKLILV